MRSKGRATFGPSESGPFVAPTPRLTRKSAPVGAGALRGRHIMTDALHFGESRYFDAGSCFQKAIPPACCATSTVATLARAFRS